MPNSLVRDTKEGEVKYAAPVAPSAAIPLNKFLRPIFLLSIAVYLSRAISPDRARIDVKADKATGTVYDPLLINSCSDASFKLISPKINGTSFFNAYSKNVL